MQGKNDAKPKEWITAAASRDTAPRIGLIPSSYRGGEEMDGRKIRALAKPAGVTEPLSDAQWEDMLQLAVELGGGRRGGLATAVGREDWVVIKVNLRDCAEGASTDPRLVGGVLRHLASRGLGRRFTIVERTPCRSFDALGYRTLVRSLASRHPKLQFELVDLADAPSIEATVEGRPAASSNPRGEYRVPRLLRECDRVISMAPLGPSLSMMNYLSFAPNASESGEAALDLFSFHPADYAIVSGAKGRNVVIAGSNALAVDAVSTALQGVDPTTIRHLDLAVKRGYGTNEAYSIWTRGTEIDEVKSEFGKQ